MPRASTTADTFNAIGDETRRAVLDVLAAAGEVTVGHLVDRLGGTQPQVSKHLKVLRDVGLVRCRHVGRSRLYRVHRPGLAPLQTWLAGLMVAVNQHHDRLDDYLEALQRNPDPPAQE